MDQTDYTYDKAGFLASETDGDGNVTTYMRDADGEVLHDETRTSSGVLIGTDGATFDLAGNKLTDTDGDNNTTYYIYNADGQVTHQETRSGTACWWIRWITPTTRPACSPPRPTAMATSPPTRAMRPVR